MQSSPSLNDSKCISSNPSIFSKILDNDLSNIKTQRINHSDTIIIGHLNINSIRNKFEMIAETITNFDIFVISESKIDSSFPNAQFKINKYKLFRYDRNRFGGGVMLYINEEIPCKLLNSHCVGPGIEIIALEFHQLKRKWLFLGCYKPPNFKDLEFTDIVAKLIDSYSQNYENVLIIGDLNMVTENTHLNNLLQLYNLTPLIKEPTCYQSQNPNCIDHILTNKKNLFKLSKTFETGLSDHHKLISTLMKSGIVKGPPKKKVYRSYKNFNAVHFESDLKPKIEILEGSTYDEFEKEFINVLDKHAPIKTKMLRFNNSSFVSKELRKEIMKRSNLRNKFNENRTHENWCKFKLQRNFCVNLYRKTKKHYYKNLNLKNMNDGKAFWKNVKPYFSNKGSSSNKISLLENDSIITDEKTIAKTMNNYFVKIFFKN